MRDHFKTSVKHGSGQVKLECCIYCNFPLSATQDSAWFELCKVLFSARACSGSTSTHRQREKHMILGETLTLVLLNPFSDKLKMS